MKKIILIFSVSLLSAVQSYSQNIYAKRDDVCPLQVGKKVPDVIFKDTKDQDISLKDIYAQKPVLLIFFRGNWCPYCNAHLSELQKIEQEVLKAGYQIVAVSPDKITEIPKTIEKDKINYTLLSDAAMKAMPEFGIVYREKGYVGLLESASGQGHRFLPAPSVFIINKQGDILFTYVNIDVSKRLSKEIILAALQNL
ncbi:MAG: peroxiredoxin-like family protein [Cytophagales bacterium]|nr:peroxiredoxin-like family protein [Cytophagales bacterium]